MSEGLNDYVRTYKEQLRKGDIQKAYTGLLKYLMSLKTYFSKHLSDRFSFGNISPGYMDFTYFPFFNDFLRDHKLRLGIVLNHEKVRLELWLMGQNAEVQKQYWQLLKTTKWNEGRSDMPVYSVLEVVLSENPDFNHPDVLSAEIMKETVLISEEIIAYIKERSTLL